MLRSAKAAGGLGVGGTGVADFGACAFGLGGHSMKATYAIKPSTSTKSVMLLARSHVIKLKPLFFLWCQHDDT